MEPDPDIIADTKSYVSTEFFFYMLPNYLAIIAFAYRYYTIMNKSPDRKAPQLPGEFLVTCFEEVYDEDIYEEDDLGIAPASYCLKSKLSLINSYVYLLMFVMGIFGDPDLYYASQHRTYSLVYILGVISWQMSAFILRREYQREMAQSLWTHRFFWIFSGTFSVSKMFEDYLQPLNFVINSTMILTNFLLALYGLYRPDDKGDAFLQIDNEIPSFAKVVFQKIEFDPTVRKLFRIIDEPPQTITLPNDSTDLTNNQLQQIQLTIASSSPQEQLQLLNKLPKRNIFVDRKTRAKLINDNVKYFFIIITQLNTGRFEAERKYSEFQELDYSLSMLFSVQNFPKLKLPRLKKDEFNRLGENDNARRAEILEVWLQELLLNPIFINESILKFLNIDELNSAAFTTYYNASYKNFCSKAFLYSRVREKNNIETRQQRVSILRAVEEEVDNGRIFLKEVKNYQFQLVPQHDSLKYGIFAFEITCKIPGKTPLRWEVKKQEEQFQTLNHNIEEELKKQVPYYYQCMLKIPQSKLNNQKLDSKKLQAYSEYLRKLLNNNQYASFTLFKFINFDVMKGEVVGDNKMIQDYQSMNALNYKRIEKSWTSTGGLPCEVTRIQVEDDQVEGGGVIYTFTLTLPDNKIKKTHSEILNLRAHLIKVYKNLATVPQVYDFSRKVLQVQLDKMKSKIDQFFSSIFTLPQVTDNPTFQRFISPASLP